MLPLKYEDVSPLEFYTYLEDIKNRLKKDAPEWHLTSKTMGDPLQTMYFLERWDFTKGKDQKWPIKIASNIFAYIADEKYYLLNKHPITEK